MRSSRPAGTRRFDRERLPPVLDYHARHGLRLLGRGPWRSAICPFHDDHEPSLRVHVKSGAFRCMACDARGGDVLDFHMRRTGKSFVASAIELGAWSWA